MNAEISNPKLTPVRPKLGVRDRLDLFTATRIGGVSEVDDKRSLFARIAAIPAAGAAILGACADGGTTDTTPPPTSSTVIESTTTAPTTIPETTTVPPTTTTTVAETTTTTEAEYPHNLPSTITMPTGEIKDPETDSNVKLGFVEYKTVPLTFTRHENGHSITLDIQYAILTGRITKLYSTFEENYFNNNELAEYIYFDVVMGSFVDSNEPILIPIKVGRDIRPIGVSESINPYEDRTEGIFGGQAVELLNENSAIGSEFKERVERFAQIKFSIPLFGPVYERAINDPRFCLLGETTEECKDYIDNAFENYDINEQLVNLLERGNIQTEELILDGQAATFPSSIFLYNLDR